MRAYRPALATGLLCVVCGCHDDFGPEQHSIPAAPKRSVGVVQIAPLISCADLLANGITVGSACAANDASDLVVTITVPRTNQILELLLVAGAGDRPQIVPARTDMAPPGGTSQRRMAFGTPVTSWAARIPLTEFRTPDMRSITVGTVAKVRYAQSTEPRIARAVALHTINAAPTVAKSVGRVGGVVSGTPGSELDGVTLSVPANSVDGETIFVLQPADTPRFDASLAQSPVGGTRVGPAVQVKTNATSLAVPARLTLPVNPNGKAVSDALLGAVVVRLPDGGLPQVVSNDLSAESPESNYDEANGRITVSTTGFSSFAPVVPLNGKARSTGSANVGCSTGTGQLAADLIDDQTTLGMLPRTTPVTAIVIHSTASGKLQTLADVLAWTYAPNPNCEGLACAAHYYIDRDGSTVRLLSENYVGYHAVDRRTPPTFANLNASSIGIELFQRGSNPPPVVYDTPAFEDAQYASLQSLLRGLLERYPGSQILYHTDVDPARKVDPQLFDRSRIANPLSCSGRVLPSLSISTPGSVFGGSGGVSASIPVTVRLTGTLSSSAPVLAELYWSTSGQFDNTAQLIWQSGPTDFPAASFGTSGAKTVAANISIPNNLSPTAFYYIVGVVNRNRAHAVSNPTQNESFSGVTSVVQFPLSQVPTQFPGAAVHPSAIRPFAESYIVNYATGTSSNHPGVDLRQVSLTYSVPPGVGLTALYAFHDQFLTSNGFTANAVRHAPAPSGAVGFAGSLYGTQGNADFSAVVSGQSVTGSAAMAQATITYRYAH